MEVNSQLHIPTVLRSGK